MPVLPRHALPLLMLSVVQYSPSATADLVVDQIEAARRAYESGDHRVAIEALNVAVSQIEEQLTEKQLQVFPDPPPGWSAGEASAQSGGFAASITGKILTRAYNNEATGAEVEITISANSPFMGFVSGMMQMPLLVQGGSGLGSYSYKGVSGLLEPKDDGSAKVSMIIDNRILLQLEGSNGADAQTLETFLDATDLEAVENAFEQ